MGTGTRVLLAFSTAFLALAGLLSCKNSESPTSSGQSTLTGMVVSGTSPQSRLARQGTALGLANVTVRVVSGSQSAQTDASGNFTLPSVPAGDQTLELDRADFHATGSVSVPAGTVMTVTVSIVGSSAEIVAGSSAGEEIEGLVLTVNAAANTLTVADLRLGTVTVVVNDKTDILHGDVSIPLSGVTPGMRAHVKALLQSDGTYLATEIRLQDVNGNREDLTGTVASVNAATSSFLLNTVTGSLAVQTNTSTQITKDGQPASFSDLATGQNVEVIGALQPDGSVLAATVMIES